MLFGLIFHVQPCARFGLRRVLYNRATLQNPKLQKKTDTLSVISFPPPPPNLGFPTAE
jgi:hypothetical protein